MTRGDFFLVTSGVANLNTAWVQQTAPPITIGTTPIVFQQFAAPITYTAGTGLNESPTYTFNIANTTVTAATYGSASAVPVFAVNAQGQLTSVTDTNIAINGSAVTGAISGQAGSVANALTLGTYLTGTSYNGGTAVTATVDATDANTASKVVARDASGNFSAGTITATLSGAATSSTTATNLAGGAANQIPYQTAAGTTSFATAASGTNTVLNFNGSAFTWVNGTISGVALGSNLNALTLGTYLTGTSYNGSSTVTAAVDATSANTASKVVARDASGNFSAGTITAALSGNATTATSATSATSATTAGSISGFNNPTTAATANTIVYRDASGYIFAVYYNASGTFPVTASANTSGMAVFTGTNGTDNYGRGYTAAAAAALLSGQTMNISGSSTSLSNAGVLLQKNASVGWDAKSDASSTSIKLVNSSGTNCGWWYANSSLEQGFLTQAGGWAWKVDNSGNCTATANITAYSDERLKKDWSPVQEGFVAKLAKVKSGTYTRIDSGERQAGVGAQSFEPLLPETVLTSEDGTLSLAYGNAAMVSAVELAKDNVELRARIEKLEALVAKLIEG